MSRAQKTRNERILQILSNSHWFLKECDSIKKEYLHRNSDTKYLLNEVSRICKLLPAYWQDRVVDYIKTGKLSLPNLDGSQIVYTQDSERNERALYIRIFRKTSVEDVLKQWQQIKKFQRFLPEVLAPDIESDLLILKVWDEIESSKGHHGNIALRVSTTLHNMYKISLGESDIRKRVSILRKLLQADKKQG